MAPAPNGYKTNCFPACERLFTSTAEMEAEYSKAVSAACFNSSRSFSKVWADTPAHQGTRKKAPQVVSQWLLPFAHTVSPSYLSTRHCRAFSICVSGAGRFAFAHFGVLFIPFVLFHSSFRGGIVKIFLFIAKMVNILLRILQKYSFRISVAQKFIPFALFHSCVMNFSGQNCVNIAFHRKTVNMSL